MFCLGEGNARPGWSALSVIGELRLKQTLSLGSSWELALLLLQDLRRDEGIYTIQWLSLVLLT